MKSIEGTKKELGTNGARVLITPEFRVSVERTVRVSKTFPIQMKYDNEVQTLRGQCLHKGYDVLTKRN